MESKLIYRLFLSLILIIALHGPAHAFDITPNTSAAGALFVSSESYRTQKGISGVVTRSPISFESIARGGTEGFIAELKASFPETASWKFIAANEDLKGSFSISKYYVFVNGEDVSGCGGGFVFDYLPKESDPVATDSIKLHWIQRIVSNHRTNSAHGTEENKIVFWKSEKGKKQPETPFFDVDPKSGKKAKLSASRSLPPHFEYETGKNDPENDHNWSSEVYLASIDRKKPKSVTIYNGIRWGWTNSIINDSSGSKNSN